MRVLLLNQAFHPDTVATAQYLTDLALHLRAEKHDVRVIAGDVGYDDPATRFAQEETWNGITIRRIGALKLGKRSRWRRACEFASFLVSLARALVREPAPDVVIALTSPPLISALGAAFAMVHRARFVFWVMDLNPDEAIAAGWLRPGGAAAHVLERVLRFSLCRSNVVIALDRFMKARLIEKGVPEDRIAVVPPWRFDGVQFDPIGRDRFRSTHGLDQKFVVMYAGNHSPCNPLDTVLNTSTRLTDTPHVHFCFIGGGSEKEKVRRLASTQSNVTCLPYQPRTQLSAMLSAADMHVVTLGDAFVGIIHPCKVYNLLDVGAPLLYVGPRESHVTDLAEALPGLECVSLLHGDVEGTLTSVLAASTATRQPSARVPKSHGPETILREIERRHAPVMSLKQSADVAASGPT